MAPRSQGSLTSATRSARAGRADGISVETRGERETDVLRGHGQLFDAGVAPALQPGDNPPDQDARRPGPRGDADHRGPVEPGHLDAPLVLDEPGTRPRLARDLDQAV